MLQVTKNVVPMFFTHREKIELGTEIEYLLEMAIRDKEKLTSIIKSIEESDQYTDNFSSLYGVIVQNIKNQELLEAFQEIQKIPSFSSEHRIFQTLAPSTISGIFPMMINNRLVNEYKDIFHRSIDTEYPLQPGSKYEASVQAKVLEHRNSHTFFQQIIAITAIKISDLIFEYAKDTIEKLAFDCIYQCDAQASMCPTFQEGYLEINPQMLEIQGMRQIVHKPTSIYDKNNWCTLSMKDRKDAHVLYDPTTQKLKCFQKVTVRRGSKRLTFCGAKCSKTLHPQKRHMKYSLRPPSAQTLFTEIEL